jgi:single-strand DNA-binding protein
MADGLNLVQLIGHLGQDAELKVLQGGKSVLNFSVATTESWLDQNNSRQEKTEWHRCQCWGRRAEGLAKILTKGMKVYVQGSLQTRSWEKNGQKFYATEIRVQNVILANGKREGGERQQSRSYGGGSGAPSGERSGNDSPPAQDDYAGDIGGGPDDEIPF